MPNLCKTSQVSKLITWPYWVNSRNRKVLQVLRIACQLVLDVRAADTSNTLEVYSKQPKTAYMNQLTAPTLIVIQAKKVWCQSWTPLNQWLSWQNDQYFHLRSSKVVQSLTNKPWWVNRKYLKKSSFQNPSSSVWTPQTAETKTIRKVSLEDLMNFCTTRQDYNLNNKAQATVRDTWLI